MCEILAFSAITELVLTLLAICSSAGNTGDRLVFATNYSDGHAMDRKIPHLPVVILDSLNRTHQRSWHQHGLSYGNVVIQRIKLLQRLPSQS